MLHGEPHDADDPVFGPPDRQLANLWWPPFWSDPELAEGDPLVGPSG